MFCSWFTHLHGYLRGEIMDDMMKFPTPKSWQADNRSWEQLCSPPVHHWLPIENHSYWSGRSCCSTTLLIGCIVHHISKVLLQKTTLFWHEEVKMFLCVVRNIMKCPVAGLADSDQPNCLWLPTRYHSHEDVPMIEMLWCLCCIPVSTSRDLWGRF